MTVEDIGLKFVWWLVKSRDNRPYKVASGETEDVRADDPVRLHEIHRIMCAKGFSKSEVNAYIAEMVRLGYIDNLGSNGLRHMTAYGVNMAKRAEANILYSSEALQKKLLAKYGSLEKAARAPWSQRAEIMEGRLWE